MAGVLANSGEDLLLGILVGKSGYAVEPLKLKLYENNVTPSETSTAGSFTEATFTGYAAIQLASADWTLTTAPRQAACAQKTFTSSASQSKVVYGYYLVQQTSGTLVVAERFDDGPYNMNAINDQTKVTAIIAND